ATPTATWLARPAAKTTASATMSVRGQGVTWSTTATANASASGPAHAARTVRTLAMTAAMVADPHTVVDRGYRSVSAMVGSMAGVRVSTPPSPRGVTGGRPPPYGGEAFQS